MNSARVFLDVRLKGPDLLPVRAEAHPLFQPRVFDLQLMLSATMLSVRGDHGQEY